ncbi:MAG: hypothetical protein EXR58_04320 [Chloroflexi bacterium]|nr:hypothetical protein [Chloroflexota bacterium]
MGPPASIEDVDFGPRWVKANAAEWNAVASSLGGIDFSSDGHQVMLSAMRPRDRMFTATPLPEHAGVDASLKYVVGCWPIFDPYARYLFAQDAGKDGLVKSTERFFGGVEQMRERESSGVAWAW